MLQIQKASLGEIAIIQQIAHATWQLAYKDILSRDQLEYMLDLIYSNASLIQQIEKLNHHFILACENNISIGFASFSPKEGTSNEVYRLHKLYVLPDHQHTGAGKTLLNYIKNEVRSDGGRFLELNVNRNNKAIDFYHRNGFSILREEDIDIGKGYFMNDYIMVAAL